MAAIKTTAKQKGDDLVINGEKAWITNGCQADWMCLLANTSEDKPHKNKSLICVPLNEKGVCDSLDFSNSEIIEICMIRTLKQNKKIFNLGHKNKIEKAWKSLFRHSNYQFR